MSRAGGELHVDDEVDEDEHTDEGEMSRLETDEAVVVVVVVVFGDVGIIVVVVVAAVAGEPGNEEVSMLLVEVDVVVGVVGVTRKPSNFLTMAGVMHKFEKCAVSIDIFFVVVVCFFQS